MKRNTLVQPGPASPPFERLVDRLLSRQFKHGISRNRIFNPLRNLRVLLTLDNRRGFSRQGQPFRVVRLYLPEFKQPALALSGDVRPFELLHVGIPEPRECSEKEGILDGLVVAFGFFERAQFRQREVYAVGLFRRNRDFISGIALQDVLTDSPADGGFDFGEVDGRGVLLQVLEQVLAEAAEEVLSDAGKGNRFPAVRGETRDGVFPDKASVERPLPFPDLPAVGNEVFLQASRRRQVVVGAYGLDLTLGRLEHLRAPQIMDVQHSQDLFPFIHNNQARDLHPLHLCQRRCGQLTCSDRLRPASHTLASYQPERIGRLL